MRTMLIILLVYTEATLEKTYHWQSASLSWGIESLIVFGIVFCILQDVTEVIKNVKR